MRSADAAIRHEPAALAHAFLALCEAGDEPLPAQRSVPRAALALLAAVAVAVALPLLWATAATGAIGERAAATLPHKTALPPPADDAEPAGAP